MSEDETISDVVKVKLRSTGDSTVMTLPKQVTRRRDLKSFLCGDLEMEIKRENGQWIFKIQTAPKEARTTIDP